MKKLPLLCSKLLALLVLPACAQVPATTVAARPIFSHGVQLSLAQDGPRGVNVISRIRGSIRKRYLQVFVGLHNTGIASLDFNPGSMTLIAGDKGYFLPMNPAEVRDMAKEAARHQILGVIGLAPQPAFGDASGNQAGGAGGQNLQAYRQTASDLYDAAVEDNADNPSNFARANLTHAALNPGEKQEGFVYFDLGRNGAEVSTYKGYKLKIPLGDQVYEMDFTETAKATVLAPALPALPPAATPVRVFAPPTPAPKPQPIAPPPAPIGNSALQVVSDPDEAEVALDGKFVGQTPLLIPLAPGDHTLRLTKDGFSTWEQKIHATGVRVTIDVELKAKMVIRIK